jgi:hypothetical protein
MSFINRDAMIIIPKKPLFEWQSKIFPESELELSEDPFSHDGGHIYLDGWCTDEKLWPVDLSFREFKKWFYVIYQSSVEDILEDEPLERDE